MSNFGTTSPEAVNLSSRSPSACGMFGYYSFIYYNERLTTHDFGRPLKASSSSRSKIMSTLPYTEVPVPIFGPWDRASKAINSRFDGILLNQSRFLVMLGLDRRSGEAITATTGVVG